MSSKAIEEYLSGFPTQQRDILEQIRAIIKKVMPDADEGISYGIPTFKMNGVYVIYFGGAAQHVSIYPVPHDPSLSKELKPYRAGKGTLHFALDKPLPDALIARIATSLLAENRHRTGR